MTGKAFTNALRLLLVISATGSIVLIVILELIR